MTRAVWQTAWWYLYPSGRLQCRYGTRGAADPEGRAGRDWIPVSVGAAIRILWKMGARVERVYPSGAMDVGKRKGWEKEPQWSTEVISEADTAEAWRRSTSVSTG